MSAGPSKTEARGDSSKVSPPHSTVPPPASGRIITSVSPVCSDGSLAVAEFDDLQRGFGPPGDFRGDVDGERCGAALLAGM